MPKAFSEQLTTLSKSLGSHNQSAIYELCRIIQDVKSKNERLVFNNGDQSVEVNPIRWRGRVLVPRPSILTPNASLVLSHFMYSRELGSSYVGDRNWYIGTVALEEALFNEESGSELCIVTTDGAREIIQQTELAVEALK